VLERYEQLRTHVRSIADEVSAERRLETRDEVVAPLVVRTPQQPSAPDPEPSPVTLAQAINATLAQALEDHDDVLVFGEDVAAKGGVYGVTRGLQQRFGATRVFDTLLDEQTVLGTALGASLAGFLPVPEIQYLAYLHNAEDQLRGEAASLRFFSAGQYANGMVVRVPGLAYQKGFGGHFHNDNSLAVLRDIPGLVVAVASDPHTAPTLLRGCLDLARDDGRVCVFVEPIARYHSRDLENLEYGDGRDLLMVTFGNGVLMSLRAAATLRAEGYGVTVLDLTWVAPLPVEALVRAADGTRAVLVVDETRSSGGVSEGIVTALADAWIGVPVGRVTSADSYVPLGPAAEAVLLQEGEILDAARGLLRL
jgi:2-oxoisovalerate dehydrogenase E1 component